MKAIIRTRYGSPDVLELAEVETPAPKDDEVLIRVHAASVNAADWHLLTADIPLIRLMGEGFIRPRVRILGADVAGRVEKVGGGVKALKPGDDVFGDLAGCGWGAFAEYACAREDVLALKPAGVTFEEAAAVPLAAVTALQGLRDTGRIRPGQRAAIYGASGGVGTFAVQIAKSLGAEVTAVCSSKNLETARRIGADHVIDYTREDFATGGRRYHLILACNGSHPIRYYTRALEPGGIYVMSGGSASQIFQAIILGPVVSRKGVREVRALSASSNPKDLATVKELLEAGAIKPVIDRRFPLSQAAEAFLYLGEGHARWKVVMTI